MLIKRFLIMFDVKFILWQPKWWKLPPRDVITRQIIMWELQLVGTWSMNYCNWNMPRNRQWYDNRWIFEKNSIIVQFWRWRFSITYTSKSGWCHSEGVLAISCCLAVSECCSHGCTMTAVPPWPVHKADVHSESNAPLCYNEIHSAVAQPHHPVPILVRSCDKQ